MNGPPELPKSFLRRHIIPVLGIPIFVTVLFGWYRLQFNQDFGPKAKGSNRRRDISFFGVTVVDNAKGSQTNESIQGEFANFDEEEE